MFRNLQSKNSLFSKIFTHRFSPTSRNYNTFYLNSENLSSYYAKFGDHQSHHHNYSKSSSNSSSSSNPKSYQSDFWHVAITCLNSFEREDDQDEPSKEQEGDENQKSGRSNGQSSTFSSEAKTSLVDTDDEHLKINQIAQNFQIDLDRNFLDSLSNPYDKSLLSSYWVGGLKVGLASAFVLRRLDMPAQPRLPSPINTTQSTKI